MPNYTAARTNMVESQIRTNKVTDPLIIEAMGEIPRERFVPETHLGVAYVDEDIAIAEGRYLMEPLVLARLLQAAEITKTDVVLDIGCATGYSTALIARLANTVVALESDPDLAATAQRLLAELDVDNVVVIEADLRQGYAEQAPYDVILFDGALARIPDDICAQLAEGGRLLAVVENGAGLGKAVLVQRRDGVLSRRVLFDASTPLLPGFAAEAGFVF